MSDGVHSQRKSAEGFAEDKAQLLLDVLIALRGRAPQLSDDGTEAVFDLSDFPEAPSDSITLKRVGGRWYIAN